MMFLFEFASIAIDLALFYFIFTPRMELMCTLKVLDSVNKTLMRLPISMIAAG